MKQPYVLAVTGGRNYSDTGYLKQVLDVIHADRHIDVLVQGGATGADLLSKQWAIKNLVQVCEFKVEPSQWRTSKSSGPVRNSLMLATCRIDVLVAFPGGRGTTDCVDKATPRIALIDLRGTAK
jgi:hypothetical protein